MLSKGQVFTELLQQALGPYVELNSVTDRPRLIQPHNGPWEAVIALGGITKVAEEFSIRESVIHDWIDNHYIPKGFAEIIACKLGYSDITDLQYPSTGYEDPENGLCWPWSWNYYCAENDANHVNK